MSHLFMLSHVRSEIKANEYIFVPSPYAILGYLNNIVTQRSNKQLVSVAER